MKIPSIITKPAVGLLSGLANNSDSILPMTVKDTISNCLIVKTYKEKGGKDDARERAIEEFGTGAVWLFGIPTVKAIINKTIYPLLKLKSDFDIKLLKKPIEFNDVKNAAKEALDNNPNNQTIKEMFETLNTMDLKNPVLKNFTNKNLYKGLFFAKFLVSTILSAFALTKIIKYKQKTTQKRIEEELSQKKKASQSSRKQINERVKNSNVYQIFEGSQIKKSQTPSFTGALEFFMYNPIANTSILDGVITATRLKEARKGERKEVALKEAFQIFFIYAIAQPTQKLFELIGNKIKTPIELDPKALFSSEIKSNAQSAAQYIKKEGLTQLEPKELLSRIYSLAKNDISHPLLNVLSQNGNISIIEKEGVKSLDYLQKIDKKDLKRAINNILKLNENISNLKGIKAYKVLSVIGNIAIGALAMGVLQPLVNIAMRKLLNNGDNRNPAIVQQEKMMNL